MVPKTMELESHYKELLKFQTDAVLDAGTPPSRSYMRAHVCSISTQSVPEHDALKDCEGEPSQMLRQLHSHGLGVERFDD